MIAKKFEKNEKCQKTDFSVDNEISESWTRRVKATIYLASLVDAKLVTDEYKNFIFVVNARGAEHRPPGASAGGARRHVAYAQGTLRPRDVESNISLWMRRLEIQKFRRDNSRQRRDS